MDADNRIIADDVRGGWRVLFKGRRIATLFKTSLDAWNHLDGLVHNRHQPEFEA